MGGLQMQFGIRKWMQNHYFYWFNQRISKKSYSYLK